jgi:membrane protein DedA with SNARE-associated domain
MMQFLLTLKGISTIITTGVMPNQRYTRHTMPSNWIHESLAYITLHPEFGYAFSFLIAFLESLPIIGTLIPGSITMMAVGTLIGTGTLAIAPTFISAIIGAFLGDFTGFLIGRLGEKRIFNIWPFKNNQHWLNHGRHFFEKYGTASVIIGRFIGPLRSAVPMVASLLGMSYSRFIAAGACSASLWSLLYILPGYIVGKYSYHLSRQELTKWIGLIILIGLILACFYGLYRLIIWIYHR